MWRGPLVLVGTAVILTLTPFPAPLVERIFSRGAYAMAQPAMTFVSNLAPFAWLDAGLIAVVAFFLALSLRDVARDGAARGTRHAIVRLIVWIAAIDIAFLALWGFNYRRERLTDRLPYEAAAVTPAAAASLASAALDRVNRLHGAAHAEGWVTGSAIDPALAGAFERIARDVGGMPRGIVVGRPKRSLLDWYFQRAGVAGMTDPVFLETIVAGDLLPFERPQIIAHEWAHLAGLADEGEANLAGWMACAAGSTADQYSGWLFMYSEAAAALPPRDRAGLALRLGNGPRADLEAIRDRTLRHVDPRVARAGWRVYDSYLKANRVEAGTRSYSEVVRLALGLSIARGIR